MRLIFILAILLLIPVLLGAVDYPYPFYPMPEYSAATTFGGLSIFQNPAALAVGQEIEMVVMHSFDEDTFSGDNTMMISRSGLGFGWQNYRLSVDKAINAYTLAFSHRVSRGFYAGASYTFMKSEEGDPYHNDHFWNTGLLWRYRREVSFGFMLKNFKRMEFGGDETEIQYKLAVGLRPWGNRISLSADWDWNEGESFGDGYFKAYGSFLIKKGMSVCGSVDEDGNFGIGLNFSFGSNQIGTYHNFADEGGYHTGLIYSGYSYRPRGWVFPVKKKFLKMSLSGSYPETGTKSFLWRKEGRTFPELIRNLNRALEDESIGGVYVALDRPALGWAQLEDLRDIFITFRKKGKPVIFYLGSLPGNGSYFLASCGNKIAMKRLDDLVLVGLLAEITFYKGALDKLGVKADMVKAGAYKSGADILSEDSMSDFHREAVDELLDDMFDNFTLRIAEGRGIPRDSLMILIDEGPFTSQEAVEYGLVDMILYPDQIPAWQKEYFGMSGSIDFKDYCAHQPYREEWGEPPQIAVIPVEGTLFPGHNGYSLLFGRTAGQDDLAGAVKYAREQDNIKAVILRLNTPGGSGLSGDIVRRELELLAKKKPLIVSMGNIAASAGYQLASTGNYIFARNATVTGSIGVYFGKADLSGLHDKIGFDVYHIKRGKNADFFSWSTGFREDQRQKMAGQIELMYSDFVETVSRGRGLSYDYIDSIAQGRIWSGYSARKLGLVDEIGGFGDALARAEQMCGLTGKEYEMVSFPKRPLNFTNFVGKLPHFLSSLNSLIFSVTDDTYSDAMLTDPLYIMPFSLKIY